MAAEENEIEFTNLDKVYFPKGNITKGEVIRYYSAVSGYLLPHLQGRPLTLKRYPDGINEPAIYQRHLGKLKTQKSKIKTARAFVGTEKSYKDFILCQSKEALLYLAQLGTIEIHPWHSKLPSLKKPDVIVFDLDPPKNNFRQAVKAALDLKKILHRLNLQSFAKTSGKAGVHVFVPVQQKYSFEKVRNFACGVGEELKKIKSNITMEARKKNRGKAVFFDCNQNSYSKSMVSVYSLRATPQATVSFPVDWARLSKVRPADFTIHNVLELLRKGDAWSPLLGKTKNSIIL